MQVVFDCLLRDIYDLVGENNWGLGLPHLACMYFCGELLDSGENES